MLKPLSIAAMLAALPVVAHADTWWVDNPNTGFCHISGAHGLPVTPDEITAFSNAHGGIGVGMSGNPRHPIYVAIQWPGTTGMGRMYYPTKSGCEDSSYTKRDVEDALEGDQ
jgi:hypothetical protein